MDINNIYYKFFKKEPTDFYKIFYNKHTVLDAVALMKSSLLYQHRENLQIIDIYIIVSNNENVINILNSLNDIELNYKSKYNFFYWIVEYNSTDNTFYILCDFMKKHRGLLCKSQSSDNSLQNKIYIRNVCKYLKSIGEIFTQLYITIDEINNFECSPVFSKYSLVVDPDIYFEEYCFKELLKKIKKSKHIIMVCPLCVDNNDDICYKNEYVEDNQEIISCFNGVALMRSSAFMNCEWKYVLSSNPIEHKRFCIYMRKYGIIQVINNVKVLKYS